MKHIKILLRSLSFQLLIRLFVILVVIIAVYAFINYHSTRSQWMQLTKDNTRHTAELVKAATFYGMLLNRKDEVRQTIQHLGKEPGVKGIRVYDKHGYVMFSLDENEIGHKVTSQSVACCACHSSNKSTSAVCRNDRMRVFSTENGERVLGLITPIKNEPSCYNADCHAHPQEQTVLGVLDVQLSLASLDNALDTSSRQLIWTTAALLLALTLGIGISVYQKVRRPVRRLYKGTQQISRGDLKTKILIDSKDELGHLARAFNLMAQDLDNANQELTTWSHQLEDKVESKTEELRRVQRQVVHMEKMASLGKLSATVAHELNNPLSGMLTYARLVERELEEPPLSEETRGDVIRYVGLIQKESSRCGDIVRNLLLFARHSSADFAPIHIKEILERSLMLVNHHIEIANIQLEVNYQDGDDQCLGDSGQLQQAMVALLVNAVEAMSSDGGTLLVKLRLFDEHLTIDVIDTGQGIPKDVLPNIFEPFFSTKEEVKGVGLGLSIVYGIIQRHKGELTVDSEVDKGTAFHIFLYRKPELSPENFEEQPSPPPLLLNQ